MKTVLFLSLVLLGCFAKKEAANQILVSGKVIKVIDGDTFDILLDDRTTKRIRMEGVDAPERGMPFYKVAKDYLGSVCFGQVVAIKQSGIDGYGRTVAKTFLSNGSDLGLLMIAEGYAWHFKKYSSDTKLANAEIDAKNKRSGLWVDDKPIAPWDWRKRAKTKK